MALAHAPLDSVRPFAPMLGGIYENLKAEMDWEFKYLLVESKDRESKWQDAFCCDEFGNTDEAPAPHKAEDFGRKINRSIKNG